MKPWFYLALLIVLGTAAGMGTAVLRVCLVPWDPQSARPPRSPPVAPGAPRAIVKVDRAEYDFGAMDVWLSGSHDFLLTNAGTANLELTKGGTSCHCALSELGQSIVPPGGSTKVTLEWKSKGQWGPYRQSATILTNDPEHPRIELTVSGRLTVGVDASPPEFVLGRISAGEPASAEVRIYCYLPEPLKITGHRWSDPSTAGMFELQFQPLSSTQVREEPDARSGFLARIVVKSGLPLGPIRQTISVTTNFKTHPVIEIPLQGVVVSDISIVGRGWNADTGVLMLGAVGRSGFEQTLNIFTRGPYRKEVRFTPGRVDPDLLHVKLGPTSPLGDGTVYRTPLTIQIPRGSRPANFLGSKQSRLGEIIIETTHPQAPRLQLRVSFATEG
jgi:hypothetical protein